MKMEYNYISEDIIERKILFEVCTLNNEQTDEEKKLFHDSWQAFDQLFNWNVNSTLWGEQLASSTPHSSANFAPNDYDCFPQKSYVGESCAIHRNYSLYLYLDKVLFIFIK